ncbi:hypothetical protein HMPREF0577_0155 [Mobiluncus mulieris ATCC 35243]|nr:hypothetical protein HMPREF0577_0155 [Mobiluncus mulieris ATCC 35243]
MSFEIPRYFPSIYRVLATFPGVAKTRFSRRYSPVCQGEVAEIHEKIGVRLKYIEPHPQIFVNFCH